MIDFNAESRLLLAFFIFFNVTIFDLNSFGFIMEKTQDFKILKKIIGFTKTPK